MLKIYNKIYFKTSLFYKKYKNNNKKINHNK